MHSVRTQLTRLSLSLCVVAGLAAFPIARASAAGNDGHAWSSDQGRKGDKDHDRDDRKGKKDHDENRGPEYGIAAVSVQRGTGAPAVWAAYSTRLGSPVGDTTGGTFRFTCRAGDGSCKVTVSAAVLSDLPASDVGFWPRVLIQRQSLGGGSQTYCEYGDGVTTDPFGVVSPQESTSTPAFTPFSIHIGGSADCGGPDPTAGAVPAITVPTGYYDVFSTFVFRR